MRRQSEAATAPWIFQHIVIVESKAVSRSPPRSKLSPVNAGFSFWLRDPQADDPGLKIVAPPALLEARNQELPPQNDHPRRIYFERSLNRVNPVNVNSVKEIRGQSL